MTQRTAGRPRAKVTREMIEAELNGPDKLTVTQVAAKLGVSRDTVERRLKTTPKPKKASSVQPDAAVPEVRERDGRMHLLSQAVGEGRGLKYVFNRETDSYITFLRSAPEPLVVSGTQHRDMAKAYSNWDGNPSSINDICRQFSFPRPWFYEYKRIHGWTHDKEPFSAEELMETPVEELADVALQMRRQALFEKFEIAKWGETQDDADKWRNFDQTVLKPLMEKITNDAPKYRPPLLSVTKSASPEKFALVLSPTDLHFGKQGWSDAGGQIYSKAQTEELLIHHTSELVQQVMRHGRPEVIFIPIGSDWFHVDNLTNSTTAGTAQDLDGLPENMMWEGFMLAVKHIDLLRQLGPVCLIFCPGNHDYQNSLSLLLFLRAWYRDIADVEVRMATQPRQYAAYGNSLLGFTHGNDEKVSQLPGLMANEAKEGWGSTANRYFFTGHLHHEVTRELDGITHYQLPSLSSADRWHDKKGFVLSRRAIHAHKVNYERGIDSVFISSVVEQSPSRSLTYGFKLANAVR